MARFILETIVHQIVSSGYKSGEHANGLPVKINYLSYSSLYYFDYDPYLKTVTL
jgi:hypothetical protein